MRAVGLSLGKTMALFTSASLVLATTTPAFAADPASGPAAPEVTKEISEGQKSEVKDVTPAPAEAPKTATDAAPPVNGKVTVHLESKKQVTLEKRAGSSAPWEHVCNSPCDETVSTADEYRIVGVGLTDSKPFFMPATESKVTLNVYPGERSKYQTGMWILGGGGVLAVAGIVFIAAGAGSSKTFDDDGITHNGNTDWITVGTVCILGGVVAGIYGGAMMYDNKNTTVNSPEAIPEKKSPQVAKREPTFREGQVVPTGASFTVPLLSGSF